MNLIEDFNDPSLQNLKGRIAEDDERAFRQLFDSFAGKLTEFAFAMLKAKDAATDIVDQVFVKIWQQRKQILLIHNLKVYLYAATKNAALNYISKKAREQVTEPFDYVNIQIRDNDSPEQQMITSEIFKKIQSVVSELPPRCKIIFKLVREDGLRYKEVAEILNISVNTVDAQMVIAVKRISEKTQIDLASFQRQSSSRSTSAKKN